jgi:hypothetical protein
MPPTKRAIAFVTRWSMDPPGTQAVRAATCHCLPQCLHPKRQHITYNRPRHILATALWGPAAVITSRRLCHRNNKPTDLETPYITLSFHLPIPPPHRRPVIESSLATFYSSTIKHRGAIICWPYTRLPGWKAGLHTHETCEQVREYLKQSTMFVQC